MSVGYFPSLARACSAWYDWCRRNRMVHARLTLMP